MTAIRVWTPVLSLRAIAYLVDDIKIQPDTNSLQSIFACTKLGLASDVVGPDAVLWLAVSSIGRTLTADWMSSSGRSGTSDAKMPGTIHFQVLGPWPALHSNSALSAVGPGSQSGR